MTAVMHILLVGAVVFIPQDVPGLPGDFGSNAMNHRLADLNGNGQSDLLLPHAVYFQHDSAFSHLRKAPNPAAGKPAACDVWQDAVFLRMPDRLRIVRWQGQKWSIEHDQPIAWPNPGNQMVLPVYAVATGLRFERFLYDVCGDGAPEIVLPDERGLRIFRRNAAGAYAEAAGAYAEAAALDVFPPLQLARVEGRQLWPESERGVSFPARAMNCRYNLSGNRLAVITRDACPATAPGPLARYRVDRFLIDTETLDIVPAETREEVTKPFAPHMRMLQMNDAGLLCVGGGELTWSAALPARAPVYETRVSTDGAETFRTVRVRGFRPNKSFVDVNQSGRADLVTESTNLFDGGIRETAARFLTKPEIRHEICVYLQNAAGTFSATPDMRGMFRIELEAPVLRNCRMFTRYQAGELINLTGDFNGDGLNDVIVQDRPDRLALYLGAPGGFESSPAATINVNGIKRFSVGDYNADGRSDISVQWRDPNANMAIKTALYLAGEDGQ